MWLQYAVATAAFAVLGFGGTLAFNSAFDRDTGNVGGLQFPPPVPPYLALVGALMMLVGLLVACSIGWPTAAAYGICVVLSVLYSAPPFRLKSKPGADLLVNVVGFGVTTPLAGWSIVAERLAPWQGFYLLGSGLLMAALFPLTQFYQLAEDRARGDNTMVNAWGFDRSLWFALVSCTSAIAAFAVAMVLDRKAWVLLPLVGVWGCWMSRLWPWYRGHATWSPHDHEVGMYRAGALWLATTIILIAAISR